MSDDSTADALVPESVPEGAADSYLRDRSFWAITQTQFLGAFNDNLFKQAILLLFVAVPLAGVETDLQGLATIVFSVPFILFSGYAGYLSDRFSKRRIIVASKIAEIAIMAAGMVVFAFCTGPQGMNLVLVSLLLMLLFCMGTQSAFFGPGKYGILPELFRNRDLPGANGLILMSTFVAIIFGMALAGWLMETFPQALWVVGLACVVIAVVGTQTSRMLRKVPPAQPNLQLDVKSLTIPGELRVVLKQDRWLLQAVIVSSVFWMAAAIVQLSVNSLGEYHLEVTPFWTSVLVSVISIGIAAGGAIAGIASKNQFNVRVLKIGGWGMGACLLLLAMPGAPPQNQGRQPANEKQAAKKNAPEKPAAGGQAKEKAGEENEQEKKKGPTDGQPNLLGYGGTMVCLIALGTFTGLFAVPIQVFLQMRPPAGLKGQMIASQNLLNWIGISLSGAVYSLSNYILSLLAAPRFYTFGLTGLIMIAVCILYRPKKEELH